MKNIKKRFSLLKTILRITPTIKMIISKNIYMEKMELEKLLES
jgi:hypothetical protein|nr:MAG TPA: hypothetical protein [Caudoviricetes sp.]DAR53745.1 MAG TPA: hypothetical protein [Caudoviricetes sp.]